MLHKSTDKGTVNIGIKSRIPTINTRIWSVIAPMLFVVFGLFGVNESAWGAGNTWTVRVGVGTGSVGRGEAYAQIYSDAVVGGGVQVTTTTATTTTLETESWTSSLTSTKAHCIYTATAYAGYHFAAWYTNAECNSGEKTGSTYTGTSEGGGPGKHWEGIIRVLDATDITYTYYAKFDANTYSVKFHANGGTGSDVTQTGFTYGTLKSLRANTFTKTGYTFAGWAVTSDGDVTYSDKQQVSIATTTNGATVDLFAKWTANQYDVTLNANGGSSSDQTVLATFDAAMPTTLKAGGAIATPERTDYTFVGYFDAQTGGTKYYNADLTSARTWNYASNKTLYAHWEATYYGRAESYSNPAVAGGTWVSCNGNKPSKPEDYKAQDYSNWQSATILAAAPTCSAYFEESQADGYKFMGWYTGANGTGELKSSAVSYTEEFTVTAVNMNPRTTITRYAYFVPVTVNSVSPATTTLTFTQPETKSVTLTFGVSNADEAADFNEPVISNTADWSLTSWSYANNQVTVVVAMTVTGNVTASGDHNTTVTLTSKGTSDNQSKSATINATVNMDPVITCTIGDNYMVDAPALDLNTLWTSTSNGTKTYSVVSFTPANSNDVATAPAVNGNSLSLSQAGIVVLKLVQTVSTSYNAAEATKTITIHKYNSTYAGVEDLDVKVDENVVSGYTLTYVKPNEAYIGEDNIAAGVPTLGENSGNFYYTLTNNVTTSVTAESPDPSLAISYVPATKTATGKNQGTGTIVITQKETYKYKASATTFVVRVSKHSNVFTNNWGDWTKDMNKNASSDISLTANNTNYTAYPIQITQTYGEEVATITSNNATSKTVTTNSTNGYSTWYIYQAANYKYNAAEADLMVTVGVPAPPVCYVVEDYNTYSFSTAINDWEGHFDTPIAINAPVDKIWFTATRQWGGYDYFVVEYTVDNGSHWRTIVDNPGLSYNDKDFGPYSFQGLQSNEKVTHIRFGAKQGATLTKWYKNIKVSRKAYLNTQDASHNNISTLAMPSNTIGNSVQAKFYVDYSTCADEILLESNNEHFTLSKTNFTANGDNRDSQKEEIVVTYTNNTVSKDTAIISIYTGYQRRVLRVTAETNRRVQTLTWQEGFDSDPITVPVGLTVDNTHEAVLASSTNMVKYTSGDEEIIQIINGGYGFQVLKAGTTTITASEDGNNTWSPVSETKTIIATDKIIQEISWQQTLPLRMEIGDEIALEASVYLRNTSTGEKTYSAARTAELTYSCPINNVLSLDGNTITIIGYGSTTITASVNGNEDYEPAASVTLTVIVRAPSTGCETPLTYYQSEAIELFLFDFSFTDWETPQLTSDVIYFDQANGKPDKLSFQHSGASYTALSREFYGGTILVEEHVNNGWVEVANSRIQPTKNAWNRLENLQLNENADAIRFIRIAGGTGYHYIKDIQVTKRQYLRTAETVINLGDVKVGEHRKDTIGFDYSDLKGDVNAIQLADNNWMMIANSGVVDITCGSHGHYDLPIVFAPQQAGEWKDTIVVVDELTHLEIRVPMEANVLQADRFIYTTEGDWGEDSNWSTGAVPGPNADVTINANVTIVGNVTVNSLAIAQGATVTVTNGNTLSIGSGSPQELPAYGNLFVKNGGEVNVDGMLRVSDLTVETSIGTSNGTGKSGQIAQADHIAYTNAYIEINMDPTGTMNDSKWYAFTVPFTVDVNNGVSRKEGKVYRNCVYGTHYKICEYDADKRLTTGKGWKYITTSHLNPGQFYYFTVNGSYNTYRFKAAGNSYSAVTEKSLITNGTGSDANWNGVGNSTLQYAKASYSGSGYVQVYQNGLDAYKTVPTSSTTFVVGCPFFIQASTASTLTLNHPSEGVTAYYAPRREQASENEAVCINFSAVDGDYMDPIYVSASDKEEDAYMLGHDLSKAGESKMIPQLWVNAYGKKLSVHEMAWQGNNAYCTLGLYVPANGEYVLSAAQPEDDTKIYLTMDGQPVWDLTMTDYTFTLSKGTTGSYGLMIVKAPAITTGVEQAQADNVQESKLIINGTLFILRNGEMFDAVGRKVK